MDLHEYRLEFTARFSSPHCPKYSHNYPIACSRLCAGLKLVSVSVY